ncbi:hypothetical protein [Vibrio coralliilyticus]|uniref:hypothetical protein n=1 Tax=Vibrio coralliilyticus TaxID=190893 RepID=UPI00148BE827|nr:hypothetical protein [Vibrio coralliilyticus]NOI31454.1 hypothetical protein [Vibrio coralliilyticus]NOI50874.1 hypothetical protein [Vibrio coralliilyticus]
MTERKRQTKRRHQKVVLDILVGNDWRHQTLTLKAAQHCIDHWPHRGYTLTYLDDRDPNSTSNEPC